jgi:proteasome beta subunit
VAGPDHPTVFERDPPDGTPSARGRRHDAEPFAEPTAPHDDRRATAPEPHDATLETGTTTAAATTEDAVVLAADRRSSLGGAFVANRDAEKLHELHPSAVAAIAGGVGGIQAFVARVRAEASLYERRRGSAMSTSALATTAARQLREGPYRGMQVLLGGVDADGPVLHQLDAGGGAMTSAYAAGGSGMQLAYGALERAGLDAGTPNRESARAAVTAAVAASNERDTASGDGCTVAVVTRDGVEVDVFDDATEAA